MRNVISWLLGFFLVANIYLIPMLEKTPRATDLIGVLIAIVLFFYFLKHGVVMVRLIAMLVISLFPFLWLIYATVLKDALQIVLSARWLLALPWAYTLCMTSYNSEQKYNVVKGMIYGILLNVIVMVLQFLGFTDFLQNIGIAAQDSKWTTVYGISRIAGMHGEANASMPVVSLIIPLCLYLFYQHRKGKWIILFSMIVLSLGTTLTLTRSPVLVSLAVLVFVLLFNIKMKRTIKLAVLLISIFIFGLIILGPPGGWERWIDPANLSVNLQGRIETNIMSINLILNNALGIGAGKIKELVGATHNAFLQATMQYGWLFGFIIAVSILILALGVISGVRGRFGLEKLLALHMTGLFMFEEHFYNPTFIILGTWIVISAWEQFTLKSQVNFREYRFQSKNGECFSYEKSCHS